MHIYVLSGPIHSGKTTRLARWVEAATDQTDGPKAARSPVGGILAPLIDGRRHLQAIDAGWCEGLESDSSGAPVVTIGPYRFSAAVFGQAREHLLAASTRGVEWLVIDEVGPLELRGEGLEPALGKVLREGNATRAVLVIREGLVSKVLARFGIPDDAVREFRFPSTPPSTPTA